MKTITPDQMPDWAPDNCPPAVAKLIDDEQYLQDLGLRGLSSADSAELHQAIRRLKGQFAGAFEAGKQASRSTRGMRASRFAEAIAFAAGVAAGVLGVLLYIT